jgi:Fe-S-cluster containining protein
MSVDLDPCVRCGACCASLRVSFHRSQLQSEGGCVPDALTDDETASICRMRGTDHAPPRCVALVGVIGKTVACGIYEQRPDPCREFEPHGLYGIRNAECSRDRQRHGLLPLKAPAGFL